MGSIVFDLDGTLVDSAPYIMAAANRMLAAFGHPALPPAQLTTFVGHGIPHFVQRIIDACGFDPARHGDMTARMLTDYSAHAADLTRPYPGVVAALGALRDMGHILGVCTNKNHGLSVQILDALDLSGFFDVVIGGDTLAVKKPDPAPLSAAYAALSAQPLLYVGDSEVDAQTAQNAGLDFALFTLGYRQTPVADLPHRMAFDHFDALPRFVAGITSRRF